MTTAEMGRPDEEAGSQTFGFPVWAQRGSNACEIELRLRLNAFLILLLLREQSGGRAAAEAESAK